MPARWWDVGRSHININILYLRLNYKMTVHFPVALIRSIYRPINHVPA